MFDAIITDLQYSRVMLSGLMEGVNIVKDKAVTGEITEVERDILENIAGDLRDLKDSLTGTVTKVEELKKLETPMRDDEECDMEEI